MKDGEAKSPIWMPLYIGDYMADTIGLTNSQHGAYLLSIMAYWRKGTALTRHELQEIAGKDIDRVCRFFIQCDGLWYHKRIDEELTKSRELIKKRKEIAMKGVAARKGAVV